MFIQSKMLYGEVLNKYLQTYACVQNSKNKLQFVKYNDCKRYYLYFNFVMNAC